MPDEADEDMAGATSLVSAITFSASSSDQKPSRQRNSAKAATSSRDSFRATLAGFS